MATTFRPVAPEDIKAFEAAIPVDSHGLPLVPEMSEAELERELERVDGYAYSPQDAAPTEAEWREAMHVFDQSPTLAA